MEECVMRHWKIFFLTRYACYLIRRERRRRITQVGGNEESGLIGWGTS